MTMTYRTKIQCPVCSTEFIGYKFATTSIFGRYTDFREMHSGYDPREEMISTCPTCGFTDYSSNFDKHPAITDDLREFIEHELTPYIEEWQPVSLKFEFLALLDEYRAKDAMVIADSYLRAAWASHNVDTEKSYRRITIRFFLRALEEGKLPSEEALTITYLVGELYRRIGNQDFAITWFNRAIHEAEKSNDEQAQRIIEIAKQQRDNPKDMFGK
jgi:uncharacterized protein